MKKILASVLCFIILTVGYSQVKDPVQWSFTAKKIDATTYEVHLTATLKEGWHLYSQSTPKGGPVPTTISTNKNPLVVSYSEITEVGKLEQHHEPLFGVDVKQFSDNVDFVQTVKLKGKVKTSINGEIQYMVCNDRECLPPKKQKFSIALK